MPAWQKRQPRVQPRAISRVKRSCTASNGCGQHVGKGASSRSGTMARSTVSRPGTRGLRGRPGPWSSNSAGTYTPGSPASSSSSPRRVWPASLAWARRKRISGSRASPSPRTIRSKKGAAGSALQAQPPPAMTSGGPSPRGASGDRSAARRGIPARSSMYNTLVKHSSCVMWKPTASSSARCVSDSSVHRGARRSRRMSPDSRSGAKTRSAHSPGTRLTACSRIIIPV